MSWQTITRENNLDISIVSLLKLAGTFRIDAEYYNPQCISVENKIRGKTNALFFDLVDKFGSGKNLPQSEQGKYFFLRTQNIRNILIDDIGLSYADKLNNLELIKEGDLLFVRVGEGVGDSVVATKEYNGSAFSDNVLRLRLKNINPFYCSVFFNCHSGQIYFKRVMKGTARSLISKENFKEIYIPIPTNILQVAIENIVKDGQLKIKQSIDKYKKAEQLLLKEINFSEYKPSEKNISVRLLTESLADNRFDAEYWQPDFDDIQNTIKKNRDGFDILEKLFELSDKKVRIDPEKEYLYAELADVNSASGTIDNFTALQGKELPSRGRMALKKNDVIVSSVEGSLEKIALVLSDKKNIIGSTGFFVLRQKAYEPEVALVLLKSKPIHQLLKRQSQGTILTAIPRTSLHRVLLPKISQSVQGQIKEKIAQSNKERQEAENLLKKAKQAVEIFIEQDEKQALAYLNKQL